MKILSLPCLSIGFALMTSAHAYAGGDQAAGNQLTLDGLKNKCAELAQDEQLKPFKAVVSCKQTTLEWRPSKKQGAPVTIENVKEVGASFNMKGYTVPFEVEQVQVIPAQASCQLWEQVKIEVPAVDIELDCEGLNKVTSIADLCSPAIEQHLVADPAVQQVESTGKTFDSCNGR